MKHKKIFIPLIIIIMIAVVCCIKISKANNNDDDIQNEKFDKGTTEFGQKNISERKGTRTTTISNTCEIKSALSEEVELHATYYLEKVYVEENQYVKKGDKVLEYTNGKYLKAPYDCYVIELNLPELEGKCLNSNYVRIESKKMLSVSMKVDESQINRLNLGQEAKITVSAIGKTYTGYVTHIGSIASNGKFDVTIEFENDGDIKSGMTSNVELTI